MINRRTVLAAGPAALAAAWETETDPAVRGAIAPALGIALALTQDSAHAQAALAAGSRCRVTRMEGLVVWIEPE